MRIMNVKRAIIILLIIGIMVVVSGCARWPDGPGPGPGEPEYQLKITVEVEGEINIDDGIGIYYIVFDYDESNMSVLGDTIEDWGLEEHYYVRYDWFLELSQKEYAPEVILLDDGLLDNNKGFWVTVDISELSSKDYIYINVLTADDLDDTVYDSLDDYFNIDTTVLGSTVTREDSTGDSEDGPDFDIINVTAEITTL